ncbi:MAG TPA: chemotaxis protein CheA [Phycisphaerae bacterium]|nr:chemotaxis protein CheA [Phycisphaerae bacterium]HRY66420.1 chemotaxis protein CheA [Phycisphaerae bacterium]HSA25872.1 chemotaxis protein CheA [Phycisphaerae bacterium]
MTKAIEKLSARDLSELVTRLSDTVGRIEPDDLSSLAQMHGWCEKVIRATEERGPVPCPPVAQQTTTVSSQLEALILGEITNVTAAFTDMSGSIARLAELASESLPRQLPAEPTTPSPSAPSAPPAVGQTRSAAPTTAERPKTPCAPQVALSGSIPATYQSQPLKINEGELEFVKGFVEEAREHIEAVEGALLDVEAAPNNTEKINDLFRPFHTIKGMAGFLNLRDINSLTHEVETLLDQGRKGERQVTPGLIDLIFAVVDILKLQVNAIGVYLTDPRGDTIPQPPVAETIDRLRAIVSGQLSVDTSTSDSFGSPKRLGDILIETGATSPEAVALAVEMQKTSPGQKLGEILIDLKSATPRQIGRAIRTQTRAQGADRPPIENATMPAQTQPAPAASASAPPFVPPASAAPASGQPGGATDLSVRIDTAKLDFLVDMVGELVIAQTLVNANSLISGDPKLNKDVGQVSKIVRNVQEMAMSLRMVQIGGTFQKMARLVRDVSRKAGKQVQLSLAGEETELDKNVIQQISDPLIHMVRNAVDHGIEPPEARRAAGKNPVGHVHLAAYHQGGNIVVEISDDGKGLDPQMLVTKGIEKGLVQPGEELTDQQAYQLIFAPGFSTAAQVTDISGRGVGMDVVRRNIDQLRGKVEIASEKGKGSTFYIRLPLTLAIIDGMVVSVGRERFIIPTIAIAQALRPVPDQVFTIQQRGEMIQVREQLIPLIPLGILLGLSERVDPCDAMVVICNVDGRPVGFVVDDLLGQQQVVIKTLGERFEGLQGIAGAAILGDGRVGLIMEASGLVEAHERYQQRQLIGRRPDSNPKEVPHEHAA